MLCVGFACHRVACIAWRAYASESAVLSQWYRSHHTCGTGMVRDGACRHADLLVALTLERVHKHALFIVDYVLHLHASKQLCRPEASENL